MATAAAALSSCADDDGLVGDAEFRQGSPPPPPPPGNGPVTVADRLAACAMDPRVAAGLVSAEVCAGADVFFRETFDGNGRNCGSCHPVENNFTIDEAFIDSRTPDDPLFIAELDPGLATLERPALLRDFGLILANVDGQEDLAGKFTLRSVPHTFSMATSITPDAGDGTTTPPLQRTGWSGDGAPNGGELRDFLTGAVIQHFPVDLDRIPGTSFRLPNDEELDVALAYQLSLGRTNELDLAAVTLTDAEAAEGMAVFIDNTRGRCNGCHNNAGANFSLTQANRNFDTGVERLRIAVLDAQGIPLDGGFGGQGLAGPNFDADGDGVTDSFGNGGFNTSPLVEAADTGPFFHSNAFGTIEEAIGFYNSTEFNTSPSGLALQAVFGTPVAMNPTEIEQIGRFLRVLNTGFNAALAIQRLDAALVIGQPIGPQSGGPPPGGPPPGGPQTVEIQRELMRLAAVEIEDAIEVLNGAPSPLHGQARNQLQQALGKIGKGLSTSHASTRHDKIVQALALVNDARDALGTNIDFTLGEGNLMF